MESFETSPERVRRIRQAAVDKRVAHQEVTELVVNARIGNGKLAEEREAHCDYANKQQGNREKFIRCKAGESALDTPEDSLRTPREQDRGQPKSERKQNRNGWLGEPTGNGGIHQKFGKSPGQKQHRVIQDTIVVDRNRNSAD
jgi:hypothetical protein